MFSNLNEPNWLKRAAPKEANDMNADLCIFHVVYFAFRIVWKETHEIIIHKPFEAMFAFYTVGFFTISNFYLLLGLKLDRIFIFSEPFEKIKKLYQIFQTHTIAFPRNVKKRKMR